MRPVWDESTETVPVGVVPAMAGVRVMAKLGSWPYTGFCGLTVIAAVTVERLTNAVVDPVVPAAKLVSPE